MIMENFANHIRWWQAIYNHVHHIDYSYIEGVHLVDFKNFGAPFVFTLSKGEHSEVVSKNASSQTLVFIVISAHVVKLWKSL